MLLDFVAFGTVERQYFMMNMMKCVLEESAHCLTAWQWEWGKDGRGGGEAGWSPYISFKSTMTYFLLSPTS
jgi:hypothetical protein